MGEPRDTSWIRSIGVGGLALGLLATIALAGAPAGTFPGSVRVGKKTLKLNGTGLCEWGFFQVDLYHAALYLEARIKDPQKVIASRQHKRIHLHFVRDLTTKQLRKAWSAAFEVNAGKDLARYRKRLDALNAMMRDVKEGQSMVFTYQPGSGLAVQVCGKAKGTIKGDDFARMFCTLYFGDNPRTRT